MEQKKDSTPKKSLSEEKDSIARELNYSSFEAACEHDQSLREQITQLAKQNLGYII